jgi:hypothetical protein
MDSQFWRLQSWLLFQALWGWSLMMGSGLTSRRPGSRKGASAFLTEPVLQNPLNCGLFNGLTH